MSSFLRNNKKKKENSNFYRLGQEINIGRKDMFSQWDNIQTSNSDYIGKKRIMLGINLCLLAYLIVSFRLFGIAVLPNLNNHQIEKTQKTENNRTNCRRIRGNCRKYFTTL